MEGEFMSLSSSFTLRQCALWVVVLLPTAVMPITSSVAMQAMPVTGGQIDKTCRGLHAGIHAEFVKYDPSNNQTPFVMVSFVLLNDGDTPQDTSPGTWTLVIDGKESSDSARMFGNGPRPTGGWRTLNSGEAAQFAYALEVSKYFTEAREYRLSWKGAEFQSPTITFNTPANNN
jgi:hypothetical protein